LYFGNPNYPTDNQPWCQVASKYFGCLCNNGKDYHAMVRIPTQQQRQLLNNNGNNSNDANAGNWK
jgi:hypothetical protein